MERRLDLWKKGEFEGLPFEGETIRKLLRSVQKPSTISETSRKFKQLMQKRQHQRSIIFTLYLQIIWVMVYFH